MEPTLAAAGGASWATGSPILSRRGLAVWVLASAPSSALAFVPPASNASVPNSIGNSTNTTSLGFNSSLVCEECTSRESTIYGMIGGGLTLVGMLAACGFAISCKKGPTTAGDCAEVAKCDCDFWDEIEKPFMPLFFGLQCLLYAALSILYWNWCTAEGTTVEGSFFVALFILSAFLLLLNCGCFLVVRSNIEAKVRTCSGFIINLALAAGLGFVAAVGVLRVEIDGGQVLGDCTVQYHLRSISMLISSLDCLRYDCDVAIAGNASNATNSSYTGNSSMFVNASDAATPCPEDELAGMFNMAFGLGTLAVVLAVAAGNCIFGYVLTLWGTKARAVILTLNALVAANFIGTCQLAFEQMAAEGFSPDILNKITLAANAAGAMAAAALKLEKASYVLQGAAMGRTAIVPVLHNLERPLREDLANCSSEVGDPTDQYPNGEWQDCDPQREMAAAWILQAVNLAAIGYCMKTATTKPRMIGCAAAAMMGADMVVTNIINVLTTVAPNSANVMAVNRLFITWGLAFLGWRVQYILRPDEVAKAAEAKEKAAAAKGDGGAQGAQGGGSDEQGADPPIAPEETEVREPEGSEESGKGEEGDSDKEKKGGKKKTKKPKKDPLCERIKIPLIDTSLKKQFDFLETSKPAKILLNFDLFIKSLVGGTEQEAPKPKETAKKFIAKVKHRIKSKFKKGVKVAPTDSPNMPDLSGGSAKKLPPL